jgi:hypothetical protein
MCCIKLGLSIDFPDDSKSSIVLANLVSSIKEDQADRSFSMSLENENNLIKTLEGRLKAQDDTITRLVTQMQEFSFAQAGAKGGESLVGSQGISLNLVDQYINENIPKSKYFMNIQDVLSKHEA